jgi:ADP-ribosylglycohydrolase
MHHAPHSDSDVLLFGSGRSGEICGRKFEDDSRRAGVPGCMRLFGRVIYRALLGGPRDEVAYGDSGSFGGAEKIVAIARGAYQGKSESDVRGNGYVVECLEAAMWFFTRTESFADAILLSANLGDDADTTAAVCGQVAGAFYGASGIPSGWLEQLAMRWEISELADRLYLNQGTSGLTA